MPIPPEDIEVQCLEGGVVNNDCPGGSTVEVTVHHEMPLFVDIFSFGPLEMTNEARMQIP